MGDSTNSSGRGRMPVLVLGGSDSKPGPVPEGMTAGDMLTGFKGAQAMPSGRCMAAELVERLRSSGCFDDPVLIGPKRIYDGLVDCEISDIEGNLAATLGHVRELLKQRFDPTEPVAICTVDILPTVGEFQQLMTEVYAPNARACFWGQIVASSAEAMGASSWKPGYEVLTDDGVERVYPGHLFVVRAHALRIRLTIHLLQLAYRYRNMDFRRRHVLMVVNGIGRLIAQDIRNLARLQLPTLTLGIPYYGLTGYYRARQRRLCLAAFGRLVGKLFVHRDFMHHADGGPPVVFSMTDIRSFAKDIDSKIELAEASDRHS